MEKSPIKDLIDRWAARRELADEIGADVAAVHKWASAGRVPSRWQASVIRAARARGFTDIDADWMVDVHSDQMGVPQ